MSDWSMIEARVWGHFLKPNPFVYGNTTVTGRLVDEKPRPRELRELSEFLFGLYSKKGPNLGHSRLTDEMADTIASSGPEVILELLTLMARVVGAPEDKQVSGLLMTTKKKELHSQPLFWTGTSYEDGHMVTKETINPLVLWAKEWRELGGDEADVLFDPAYASHGQKDAGPAIHGATPEEIAGAMMGLIFYTNRGDLIGELLGHLPNPKPDQDGWVTARNA